MGRAASLTALAGLAVLAVACLRPGQAVVVIDTDLPLPSEVASDPSLSPATSFDRVEVEVLGADGSAESATGDGRQLFVVGDGLTWPLSFGVRDGLARLRIRAYRAAFGSRTRQGLGDPSPRVVLERLVIVDVSSTGRQTLRVVLHGECIGTPSDGAAGTTCIDDPRALRPANQGLETLEEDAALPGRPARWPRSRETPCNVPAPADALCVPGGTFVRGDAASAEIDATSGYLPTPLVVTSVAPFFMDRTEVTVGRFRALVAKGQLGTAALPAKDASCTWSDAPGALEQVPVTCVSADTARAACRASGGDLPSEAQWEYAARGRGLESAYPWGDADPACCTAHLADTLGCSTKAAAPSTVGAHADGSRCDGLADVSRDGVLDLAGNVRERVLDAATSYDSAACAPPGIAADPVCVDATAAGAARGGSFRSAFPQARATTRTRADLRADDLGFRCVYPGAAP